MTNLRYPSMAGGAAIRAPGDADALDPANQSLADALRKSFSVLKLLMFILLVLYFLSGLFSVKPNEVGVRTRYGRIVANTDVQGAANLAASAVLQPGWHWSWPYPIERYTTVSTSERQIPVEFMFELTEAEKTGGIKGYRYDVLSPLRDDCLLTGDVNIIHASIILKYRINDDPDDNAVHYLQNIQPQPDPAAGPRSPEYLRYPEYQLLVSLVRNAVIEAAARGEALRIRGEGQQAFLEQVGERVCAELAEFKQRGTPLGIRVDPATGILGVKKGEIEPIMPPRQTQEVFDQVQSAGEQKAGAITKTTSEAQALLVNTAGPDYLKLSAAIDEEYRAMLALSAAESAAGGSAAGADIEQLRATVQLKREEAERLLTTVATGSVRAAIRNAEIVRDGIIKEAAGDYDRFLAVRPEYLRHPTIFVSRLLTETYAEALRSPKISKIILPEGLEWRITLPRTGRGPGPTKEEKEKAEQATRGTFSRPEPVMP